ncbi:MAG TPA: 16S rRNA (guanine(966)-N(2))-methyltransferase RsmD [Polyangiales bacterium]|nr:16S rRNA (guanine(966)-N(2))-methyltransferase RsmD [Polyangiales bacterium]
MGQIRIVGGSLGGRRLQAPATDATRPTSDRVREAIASVLAARDAIESARVLDLYAGSGALGFEMLSRGAQSALFVERDPKVARLIRDNAGELGVTAQCEVLSEDVTRQRGEDAIVARGPFSLLLADPPYRDVQRAVDAIVRMVSRGVLDPDACLLLEHGTKGAPVLPSEFAVLSSYRYGDTTVVLCRATPPAEGAGS